MKAAIKGLVPRTSRKREQVEVLPPAVNFPATSVTGAETAAGAGMEAATEVDALTESLSLT